MSEPQTWRDKQAARPDPVSEALRVWWAGTPKRTVEQKLLRDVYGPDDLDRALMAAALEAAEAAEALARQCDEPGCEHEASCGFAVDGGYRRTCYEHSRWAKL
jgi:hypothetical protein